jgi:hypothetical protein
MERQHRTGWRAVSAATLGLAAGAFSCADPVEPEFASSIFTNCRIDDGIEICIDRSRYTPGDVVMYTISNGLPREVYEDLCTGGTEGRRSPGDAWGGNFGAERMCDYFVDHEAILRSMRPLPRGELITDMSRVNGRAYAGEWRLRLKVLNAGGYPIRNEPFTSPVFTVVR